MPNLDTQTNLVRHFEGLATREPGALLDNELWWRDHYQVLENRGYRLRPRYRPDWVPSWRMSGKNPYTVEDGQPSLIRTAMDATHLDGRQAMLKSIPARRVQQELEIVRLSSSPELRRHPRNHCVPLLDVIELPDTLDEKLIVMPLLRPFDRSRFQTYGEFVAFFAQISEGLQFMHERNIAHRYARALLLGFKNHIKDIFFSDCTANNIMLDPSEMYPKGFHPVNINRSRDFKSNLQQFDRTRRPPRYYLIDFGLSRQYSSRNALDDPLRGGDKSAPEHQSMRRCNPFHTDIYHLGNLVRERFIKKYNGFRFMKDLVDAMTAREPSKRPMIEDVIATFAGIRESLSVAKLRSPITSSREGFVITALRYTSRAIRTVQYIVLQKPAIPVPITGKRSGLDKAHPTSSQVASNRAANAHQSDVTGEGAIVPGPHRPRALTQHIVSSFRSQSQSRTSSNHSAYSPTENSSVSIQGSSEVFGSSSDVADHPSRALRFVICHLV